MEDVQKYCNLMEEVKRRIQVFDFFLSGKGHALYKATTIESISLQLRKVLELIAFGSLVANKNEYSKIYDNFAKAWNAKRLLQDIARINPHFYPKPIIELPAKDKHIKFEWKNRDNDYLTESEFVEVYTKCGAIMHANNPYGLEVDYAFYEKNIPIWRERIINLLKVHQIKLISSPNLYLIHMGETRDHRVHYYVFEPVPRSQINNR